MFDPYHKWLGIPPDQRPPTYYQLLGVSPGEEDVEVIEEAAIRQAAHLRTYQIGPHATECTRVLTEIAEARRVLRDPAKRRTYDQSLAKKRPHKDAGEPIDLLELVTPPASSPRRSGGEDFDAHDAHPGRRDRERDRERSASARDRVTQPRGNGLTIGLAVGAAGLAVVGLVVFLLVRGGDGDDKQPADPQARKKIDPLPKQIIPPLDVEDKHPVDEPKKNAPLEIDPKIDPGANKNRPAPVPVAAAHKWKLDLVGEHKEFANLHGVLLSPDGQKLALSGSDKGAAASVVIRSVDGWKALRRLSTPEESFSVLAFSADSGKLLVAVQTANGSEARSIDLRSGAWVRFQDLLPPSRGAYSPDGRWVALACGDPQGAARYRLHVFKTEDGESFRVAQLPVQPPHALVFSADSARVYTCDRDSSIREYTVAPGRLQTLRETGPPAFTAAAFGSDGRSLVVRTSSMQLLQYTLEPFGLRRVITAKTPEHQPTSLAVSEDSELIVVGTGGKEMPRNDCTAVLLDGSSGHVLGETRGASQPIVAVSASHRGRLLVAADEHASLRLWRWAGGEPPAVAQAKKSEPDPKKVDPVGPKKADPPEAPKVAKIWPIPEEGARKEAEKAIREQYQKDYAKKAIADRLALAEKLLAAGSLERSDMTVRYVALCQARDLAAQAGKVGIVLKAVDELTRDYALDETEAKREALTATTKGASKDDAREVAEAALAEVADAVADDAFVIAFQFLSIAEAAARKSGTTTFVTQVLKQDKQIKETASDFERMKSALVVLEKDPDNPEANLTAGKYLSVRKGEWNKALPLLAKSGDAVLSELARIDLKNPQEPKERVDLADRWWSAAQKDAGLKAALLARAGHWYRQALPQLTGLTQERVAKRVKEVEEPPSLVKIAADSLGEIRRFKGHTAAVTSFLLSPDGKRLFSGSLDSTLRTWDAASGKLLTTIPVYLPVQSFAPSPDSRYVFVSSGTVLRILDWRTGKPARPEHSAKGAAWNRADLLFFTRDALGIWHVPSGGFSGPGQLPSPIRTIVFSPDVSWAVALQTDGQVHFLQMVANGGHIPRESMPIDADSAAFASDLKRVAFGGKDGSIPVVDFARKETFKTLTGHTGSVRGLAFSPSGRRLLSGGSDKTVRLWDVAGGKELYRFTLHTDAIHAVAFATDARSAFSAAADATIRHWRLPREK